MTAPLVRKLTEIHNENFGAAGEKIKKYQEEYKKKYDRRNNVQPFLLRKGSPVQVRRMRSKKAKGSKNDLNWIPRNSFYTIYKIDKSRKKITVRNPKNGNILKKTYNFDLVRKFQAQE